MEIWISSGGSQYRIPVLPAEVSIATSNKHERIDINKLGQIVLPGNEQLSEFEISSFFPNQLYPFVEYSNILPVWDNVSKLDKWRKNKNIVKLTVTGTPIRMDALIESFEYKQQDGSGDIYYRIEFVEYERLKVRTKSKGVSKVKRPAKKKAKTYTVKRGDNLWNIAKRFTGSGANYKNIAKANGIKNPNKIYPKQVIRL